jgi:hypothetical protein
MTIVPLPSHGLSATVPKLHHTFMPPCPPVLKPNRRRSFRPTLHRLATISASPSIPRAPVHRFRYHRRWLPSVQLKSGWGGSRPEGKRRGGARGAGARSRIAGEATVPWWQCGQGTGGHSGPHRVLIQPPSLLFAEIPLPLPAPPRPSHVELARGPLRSHCCRLQQCESSHGLR